jgi:predicted NAD-dependent protein-ADP-ribosyltransferase YbiA (DUF1768 family)
MEFELAGGVGLFEVMEEQASEETGEDTNGKEEALAAKNPAAAGRMGRKTKRGMSGTDS